MHKLALILMIFSLQACKSTTEDNISQSNSNKSQCDLLSSAIGPMVATKWALRATAKTEKDKKLGDWRMLGLVHHEAFAKLGFSIEETKEIAKTIHQIDISNRMEYDILSYRYFYKAQCELEAENVAPLELTSSYQTLDQCWYSDKNQGLEEEVCFKKVLAGEIVL